MMSPVLSNNTEQAFHVYSCFSVYYLRQIQQNVTFITCYSQTKSEMGLV